MQTSTADAPYFHNSDAAAHPVAQQVAQALQRQAPLAGQRALPNNYHSPAIADETVSRMAIASRVRQNLCSPPFSPGCRQLKKGAIMLMPETTMNENRSFPFWQDDVGRTRKLPGIQTIPKACAMQESPHGQLGTRIDPPDSRHPKASLFRSKNIGHSRASALRNAQELAGICCTTALVQWYPADQSSLLPCSVSAKRALYPVRSGLSAHQAQAGATSIPSSRTRAGRVFEQLHWEFDVCSRPFKNTSHRLAMGSAAGIACPSN